MNLHIFDILYIYFIVIWFYYIPAQICVVSTGSPGDGIDNDCDGLVDEECCSDSKEPGTMGMMYLITLFELHVLTDIVWT